MFNCEKFNKNVVAVNDGIVGYRKILDELQSGKRDKNSHESYREIFDLMKKVKKLIDGVDYRVNPVIESVFDGGKLNAFAREEEEIKFDINEVIEKSKQMYQENGIDWVKVPDKMLFTKKQIRQMQESIEDFGFNRAVVIPARLAVSPARYEKLFQKIGRKTDSKKELRDHFSNVDSFINNRNTLRLVFYRADEDSQSKIDELSERTRNEDIKNLKKMNGLLGGNELSGVDLATFLVLKKMGAIKNVDSGWQNRGKAVYYVMNEMRVKGGQMPAYINLPEEGFKMRTSEANDSKIVKVTKVFEALNQPDKKDENKKKNLSPKQIKEEKRQRQMAKMGKSGRKPGRAGGGKASKASAKKWREQFDNKN